jgi:Holliday junction resolvasome RuvABC endonuclease subunit
MLRAILLTRFAEYHTQAKAIQRSLGKEPASTATVQQAVADLADLAVKTPAEINDAFEGLAVVVTALHPEVTRASRRT